MSEGVRKVGPEELVPGQPTPGTSALKDGVLVWTTTMS